MRQRILANLQVLVFVWRKDAESKGAIADVEKEFIVSTPISKLDDWANFVDDNIIQQQSAIHAEEAKKIPFVGDKVRETHDSLRLLNMVGFALNFGYFLFGIFSLLFCIIAKVLSVCFQFLNFIRSYV